MQFGVREITDIVFKSIGATVLGTETFVDGEPVIYFDSAKTSTLESASTTVYAQGGKGNPRLIAWEGDRTATFTFEDALLSPLGFSVLSGANAIKADKVHFHEVMEVVATDNAGTVELDLTAHLDGAKPVVSAPVFVMRKEHGSIVERITGATIDATGVVDATGLEAGEVYIVDFYTERPGTQLEVEAGKFAGYYYIEANTLFRRIDGVDVAAQFTIPKGKIQSNFTFTMAPTGDPSTFTFTVDAFPAKTRFSTKTVLFALDIADHV